MRLFVLGLYRRLADGVRYRASERSSLSAKARAKSLKWFFLASAIQVGKGAYELR